MPLNPQPVKLKSFVKLEKLKFSKNQKLCSNFRNIMFHIAPKNIFHLLQKKNSKNKFLFFKKFFLIFIKNNNLNNKIGRKLFAFGTEKKNLIVNCRAYQ